jgi:transcription elongation factor GreA
LPGLEAELAELEGEGRREIAERIKTAREWGDLKENSEYHDAKNDQAHLETKIARLREKIAGAVIVEEAPAGAGGVVGFGSTVVVRDQDGAEHTWRIVSSHDAAPGEGRLSAESPVAVALLGRAPATLPRCSASAETPVQSPLPKGKRVELGHRPQRRLSVARITATGVSWTVGKLP